MQLYANICKYMQIHMQIYMQIYASVCKCHLSFVSFLLHLAFVQSPLVSLIKYIQIYATATCTISCSSDAFGPYQHFLVAFTQLCKFMQ